MRCFGYEDRMTSEGVFTLWNQIKFEPECYVNGNLAERNIGKVHLHHHAKVTGTGETTLLRLPPAKSESHLVSYNFAICAETLRSIC